MTDNNPSMSQSTVADAISGESAAAVESPLLVDIIMELLAARRRRYCLSYFLGADSNEVDITGLVNHVSQRERTDPSLTDVNSRAEQLKMDLYHTHLPKLADAGLVDYDRDDGTVTYHSDPLVESFLEDAQVGDDES
jgi:DNA-binding transcriptional ArsR family regulator